MGHVLSYYHRIVAGNNEMKGKKTIVSNAIAPLFEVVYDAPLKAHEDESLKMVKYTLKAWVPITVAKVSAST